jgi:hypothetical protein
VPKSKKLKPAVSKSKEKDTLKFAAPCNLIQCSLCKCFNHDVYQCLLRYTPNVKSQKLKGNQVWVPKKN